MGWKSSDKKGRGRSWKTVGWGQKRSEKIEIEKTHSDLLLSFNQAVTVTTNRQSPLVSMATTLSGSLSDTCGCLISQRFVLAAVSGRPLEKPRMKSSAVRVLGCSAFRGSDRFTAAVSVRQRQAQPSMNATTLMLRQRRKKQTRLVRSHFAVFLESSLKARTRPPISDGEMVDSSTRITPPCFRSSSAHALSNGG